MSHKLSEVIRNLSVDCVIFGFENGQMQVLLVKRAIEPGKGSWALPGGFVLKNERIDTAAKRVLQVTTGVHDLYLEQIGIMDEVDRFPLWRVFTIAHFALVSPHHFSLAPGIDTTDANWFGLNMLPKLVFDHEDIIHKALNQLRSRIRTVPIGFDLLPKEFTIPQLQKLYEGILGHEVDKRNFRKKLQKLDILKKGKSVLRNNRGRSAALYSFDLKHYKKFLDKGFVFDL